MPLSGPRPRGTASTRCRSRWRQGSSHRLRVRWRAEIICAPCFCSFTLCLCGELLFSATRAIAADLKPRNQNVELAIALDLSLHAVEQVALEFLHLAAPQAGHVHVVALRTPLVEVTFPLYVQQVEFIHQSLALE